MHRPKITIAACTVIVLLSTMVWMPGCISSKVAEGRYFEAESSGRLGAWVRDPCPSNANRSFPFFRLHLVQFNNEATGVIELFDDESHDRFLNRQDDEGDNYFCTRIVSRTGSFRDNNLSFDFVDNLHRAWEVRMRFDADSEQLRGELFRIDATDNSPIPTTDRSITSPARDVLTCSTQAFTSSTQFPDMLVLDRQDDSVTAVDLDCTDFRFVDTITVTGDIPLDTDAASNPTLALLLTRKGAQTLQWEDVEYATLDEADVRLNNGNRERELVMRRVPDERNLDSLGVEDEQIAVGTLIVFNDDGDLEWNPDTENILAYARDQVIVFNSSSTPDNVTEAQDSNGQGVGSPLFANAPRRVGWHVYQTTTTTDILEDDGRAIQQILTFDDLTPGDTISMESFPSVDEDPDCHACYRGGDAASCQRALERARNPDTTARCGAVFPLLVTP